METRRLTAKKAGLREILNGKFVKRPGFESSYVLTKLGRKLSRVRILGLIVDKFVSQDERYAAITLDDGTETIRCKVFMNVKTFDGLTLGDLVDVFGKVKEYNDEIYIIPEMLKKVDPNFETLRILELEKIFKEQKQKIKKIKELQSKTSDANELKISAKKFIPVEDAEGIIEAQDMIETEVEEKTMKSSEVKDKILKIIENHNDEEGLDYQYILKESGFSENEVDLAVQDLLESGICFEPKAGKIKKL